MEAQLVMNAIVWFDVPTLDFDRAIKFYSTLLGQEIKPTEFMGQKMAFFPMQSREGVGGDIMPPAPDFKPSTNGTRVYLNVNGQLDAALSRVEPAGGKIIQPKFEVPDVGFLAFFQDTEGNVVGLWSKE